MTRAKTQLSLVLIINLILFYYLYAMLDHPWEYHLESSPHSYYMVLQTNTCYHKMISIGVVFPSNSNSNLLSLHTLAWACVLQFKLSIILVFLISIMCLYSSTKFMLLFIYVSSTSWRIYKLKLRHKLTTEHTLHSQVKLSITQNVDCIFLKL